MNKIQLAKNSVLMTALLGLLLIGQIAFAQSGTSVPSTATQQAIEAWLKLPAEDRPEFSSQSFASTPINSDEASAIKELLWEDYKNRAKTKRKQEWQDKKITIGENNMRFDYKVFGDKPETGRSLYISMHGGGGTRARVNEQQWKNQIGLYQPDEGVYLAPRAPTDAWNMWHKPHIDGFFERIIQDAIVFEDVDPNKVYLMGYSAGGDGVYQMAARMADAFAAAAMMAGHPNGVSPLNLRNIGFTIHMGENDGAYKRNKTAGQWKEKLAKRAESDPGGYKHEVTIHQGMGHWMQRKDAVAVPWMAKFIRDPLPKKIAWRQTGVTRNNFYWLAPEEGEAKKGSTITITRDSNRFEILSFENLSAIRIRMNASMVNFSKPIEVSSGDKVKSFKAQQTAGLIYRTLEGRGDPGLIFSSEVVFHLPQKAPETESESDDEAKKAK